MAEHQTSGNHPKSYPNRKVHEEEIRKSESIWLVTLRGMIRVFGPEDEHAHPQLDVQQLHYNDGKPYSEVLL